MKDLIEIKQFLIDCIKKHQVVLQFDEKENQLEAKGTLPAMQGKQKVDGFYFASIVPKPKDVRLYFFPLYTHADQFKSKLSAPLAKMLKGKTCFHLKNLDPEVQKEIQEMIDNGIKSYQKDGLLKA